jgi:UDP-glucose 4-epimerase
MRFLVLGGAGFIGKNLIMGLLKKDLKNTQIISFDNNNKVLKENFELKNYPIFYEDCDFNLNTDFRKITKEIDVVFHLISTTNPGSGNNNIRNGINDNVLPTLDLLDACRENKVKKIIFISSGGTVYGDKGFNSCEENDRLNPICSYGLEKVMIEKYLYMYNYLYSLDYKIIRLANPYGIDQIIGNKSVGAVAVFIKNILNELPISIWGDGEIIRDYIYIEDVIEGIINITEHEGPERVFNLGTGIGKSLNELIDMIKMISGKRPSVNYLDKRNVDLNYNVLNNTLYNKVFKKNSYVSLENGIKKMVKQYFEEEI